MYRLDGGYEPCVIVCPVFSGVMIFCFKRRNKDFQICTIMIKEIVQIMFHQSKGVHYAEERVNHHDLLIQFGKF